MSATAAIAELHYYPVKGARGIALAAATAEVTGLRAHGVGDREWMVVDATGRFLTQREVPRLALIAPTLEREALVLRADGSGEVGVPLQRATTESRAVIVWRSHVRGHDEGEPAARWLSGHLERDVRLVRFDRASRRACNPDFVGSSGAHTFFSDGYPVLVIGRASLDDLNARLAAQGHAALPLNRFRPNVVLEGLPAYEEDHLEAVHADGITLRMVKPCTRCQVTTTDQSSAAVGIEPLPTLAAYRHSQRFGGVCFGMNAIVTDGAGKLLRAGSPAEPAYRF